MPIITENLTDFDNFFNSVITPQWPSFPIFKKKSRLETGHSDLPPVYSLDMIHLLLHSESVSENICRDKRVSLPFVLDQENQLLIASELSVLNHRILMEPYLAAGNFEFELIDDCFIFTGFSANSTTFLTDVKNLGLVLKHLAADDMCAIEQGRLPVPMLDKLKLHRFAPMLGSQHYWQANTAELLRWAFKNEFHIRSASMAFSAVLEPYDAQLETDSDVEVEVVRKAPPRQNLEPPTHSKSLFSRNERSSMPAQKRMRPVDDPPISPPPLVL